MGAVEYNRRRHRQGKFTDEEVAKLVMLFQEEAGHTFVAAIDGKFGPKTKEALDEMEITVEAEPAPGVIWTPHDEGPKEFPTPNPEVWKDWVYPMIVMADSSEPGVSSGFSQYGKGPNAEDRPNHWGDDIMRPRHPGDGGPEVRKDKHGRWYGNSLAPTHSKYWYCLHGVDIVAAGPGTIWSVNLGANNNVLIDHHNVPGFGPLTTWYQHLHEVFVESGDEVEAGEVIAICGAGTSNLIHLHFEFRDHNRGAKRAQAVVNPEPYLDLFTKRAA